MGCWIDINRCFCRSASVLCSCERQVRFFSVQMLTRGVDGTRMMQEANGPEVDPGRGWGEPRKSRLMLHNRSQI